MTAVAAAATAAPGGLTPDRVLDAVKTVVGDRAGAGLWVDVKTGELDKGATITLYEAGRLSAIGLAGRKTFGGALGYEVAKSGNVEASVFAGAAHPYEGVLSAGWHPVAGVSIKF